jgi:CubicO group peptidase (beta-lactamase class C family)
MRKIAILAAMAAGCVGCTVNYSQPVAPAAAQTLDEKNFDAVWRASLDVLREYRFSVAVEDRREGTIITYPLLGRAYGEFWRKDAVTPSEVAESTLQTIYKTATVTILPASDEPNAYVASVAVEVARSDKPSYEVTSTSEAYGLFTSTGSKSRWLTEFGRGEEQEEAQEAQAEKRTAAGGLRMAESQPTTAKTPSATRWRVDLGRDPVLERQMTSQIAAALARMPGGNP